MGRCPKAPEYGAREAGNIFTYWRSVSSQKNAASEIWKMLQVYPKRCKKNKQHFHQTCSIFTQKMLRLRCEHAPRLRNMVQDKLATFSLLMQHFTPKNAAFEIWKCCKSTKNAARGTNNIFTKHAAYSPKECFFYDVKMPQGLWIWCNISWQHFHYWRSISPPKNAAWEFWKCCKSTTNGARGTNNIFTKHAAYSPKKCFFYDVKMPQGLWIWCNISWQHFHYWRSISSPKTLRENFGNAASLPQMVQEVQTTFSPNMQHIHP